MADSIDKIETYLLRQANASTDDSRLLSEVAYHRLKDAIKNAGVQAGDPLSETRLSNILGISRTPIREALRQLAEDGLLQVIPGRAIVIASRSAQEVLDALHVRELLEPEVIRLAADALSTDQRELLEHCTEDMEHTAAVGDRPGWKKADSKWHEILCYHCPNQLMGQMVLQARNHMYVQSGDPQVSDQYLIDGTKEHRDVAEAINARQGERAAQLMTDHIQNVRKNMFNRLVR